MNWWKYLSNAFDSIEKKKSGSIELNKDKTIKELERLIKSQKYEFKKWTPFLQQKEDGDYRPLISPPIKDRIVLKALADYCSSKLAAHFATVDDVSFAYQKGKGPRDAFVQLKKLYKPGNVIVKIDIRKFFNNIDKQIVMGLLKNINLNEYAMLLIEQSLYPSLVKNHAFDLAMESIQNGIPQGNPVSAVLSNLYLIALDKLCKNKGIKLIRYADDMIIIVDSKDSAYEILDSIEIYLKQERKLSIHPLETNGKTAIFVLPQKTSLTYLGVVFDGQRLLPSNKCQSILSTRIKSIALNESLSIKDRNKEICTYINQWCGYYAFTDLSKSRLKKLSNSINHNCRQGLKDEWHDVDLFQKLDYYKNKQNKKRLKIFNRFKKKFGEEYDWLICY